DRIEYGALEGCREKTGADPVITLKRALDNVKPSLEVRSRRVGGATYQVPVDVRPARSTTLALRWLVTYSRGRREKTMTERLMNELLDASNGLGAAVKRREDMHKMAESNKAFARLPERGGRSRSDGNAAFLLLLHPVHGGSAVVNLTDLVRDAGVVQDALGGRGLAGIDVRHDPDVPGLGEDRVAGHCCCSSSGGYVVL
ncbi:MAG: ribosomal protein, partial [Frankiales bacterium]|nr:ribosomal protein [Frankiales bacterium]